LDPYRAWRSPDGEIAISPLRAELLAGLPKDDTIEDAAMHDSEHSLEALAYWIKHLKPDVEILPVIVAAAKFPRSRSACRSWSSIRSRTHFGSGVGEKQDRLVGAISLSVGAAALS
jgi:AmmeMemoRadiSam system protein B